MKSILLLVIISAAGCAQSTTEMRVPQSTAPDVAFELALRMAAGDGVTVDPDAAFGWFVKAAEGGHALAQYHVSSMLLSGNGVERDTEKAFEWAFKSANQGVSGAQFNLALMYRLGDGTLVNAVEAVNWTLKAAMQGHAGAQYNLGVWSGTGEMGVTKSQEDAFKWYLLAAKQGNQNAQVIVGGRYHMGQGVNKDAIKGHVWLSQGDSNLATRIKTQFMEKMSDMDLEKADILAVKCKESQYQDCD